MTTITAVRDVAAAHGRTRIAGRSLHAGGLVLWVRPDVDPDNTFRATYALTAEALTAPRALLCQGDPASLAALRFCGQADRLTHASGCDIRRATRPLIVATRLDLVQDRTPSLRWFAWVDFLLRREELRASRSHLIRKFIKLFDVFYLTRRKVPQFSHRLIQLNLQHQQCLSGCLRWHCAYGYARQLQHHPREHAHGDGVLDHRSRIGRIVHGVAEALDHVDCIGGDLKGGRDGRGKSGPLHLASATPVCSRNPSCASDRSNSSYGLDPSGQPGVRVGLADQVPSAASHTSRRLNIDRLRSPHATQGSARPATPSSQKAA